MAGTKITGSTNISLLDSLIYANVCDGKFLVNTTPSAFIGLGASNVLGAKIEIKNPYGVVIKTYGASYDIAPPMTGSYEFNIPTQAGKLQYGIYTISVQLTDADNKTYVVTKQVNVCNYTGDAYPCDERVRIVADCKNGRFNFQLLEPPAFKGKYAISQVQSIRVDYPTASGIEPEETPIS